MEDHYQKHISVKVQSVKILSKKKNVELDLFQSCKKLEIESTCCKMISETMTHTILKT